MTRRIISGSHYTYNASQKKIWLSYEFYDLTVENIFLIRNLTKNKLVYHCKNPQYSIEVVGGCITHTYPGEDDSGDKLQIILNTPITDSLEELTATDGVVAVETVGKILALPTDNLAVLPMYNQGVLNSARDYNNFTCLKGAGSPDYSVGTLFCQTDGVYITDINGNNSTKTLTAGKQKELGTLSVDTVNHSVTQEFIIANTATSNSPTVIDNCDATTGWYVSNGSGAISIENGRLKIIGTSDSSGYLLIQKTFSFNASSYSFMVASIESSVSGSGRSSILTGTPYKTWESATRFPLSPNSNTRFIYPLDAPSGVIGMLPSSVSGTFAKNNITSIKIGVMVSANTGCTFYIDNITADVAKSAFVELQTTNELADTSMVSQKYTGSTYETNRILKLDSTASVVSADTTKMVFGDQTKFDDVYGNGLGRSNFPKGSAGETKSGTLAGSQITYSENAGTDKRVGFRVDLPPSDGGRTAFNSVRLKIITYYSDVNKATNILPDLSGNGNNGTMSCVGLTADGAGNAYGAMSFNGVRSIVDCGTSAALQPTSGLFTLNIWINPTESATYRTIINNCGLAPGGGYSVHIIGDNKIEFLSHDSGGVVRYRQVSISINSYSMITCVSDGTYIKIYINGSYVNRSDCSGFTASANKTVIGALYTSAHYYKGYIGNTRIYSRVLSDGEITALYNNQPVSSTGLVASWQPATVSHMGSTQYDFADSTNASYGLQNLSLPWLALYDPATSIIDFYRFTRRPQNLSFKRDESGVIYELSLYPGTGSVYHGQITYAGLTTDSDSDLIPDCLEANVNNSVTNFLKNYTMVIDE